MKSVWITRQIIAASIILCVSIGAVRGNQINQDDSVQTSSIWVLPNGSLNMDNQLSEARQNLNDAYSKSDTSQIIFLLIQQSYRYAHMAEYNLSYDGYWEALLLAEKRGDSSGIASVYYGLGWLYSFYGRHGKAHEYFNESLIIQKKFYPESNNNMVQPILDTYYALATINRKAGEIALARKYLDSCQIMRTQLPGVLQNSIFMEAEFGYLLLMEGRVTEALNMLKRVKEYFENNDPSYLVILYPFLARAYEYSGEYKLAEQYFLEAINYANRYHSHLDLLPEIYEDLSKLHVKTNQIHKAYEFLTISKKLNEQQFGSRSKANQGLLEIKDSYRIEKEKQDQLIQKQRLEQLEQDTKIAELKNVILYGAILFLVILGFLIYRHLRIRYKAEKRFLQHQRALELEKANEVLQIKNKELTASALHSIEREELLEEIKEELGSLKGHPEMKEVGRLMKNIDHRTSKSWEEFEVRFMSVHEGFYERLQSTFPNLSQNDHKLCALIKLNFSSKDMSRLMGISIESVHTTRYRLRKKLGLNRSDNLEDFVARKI